MNKKVLLVTLGLGIVCILPSSVLAAPKKSVQQGISLSPFQKEVTIDANLADQTYDLQVTNNTSSVQELSLSTRDFGSLNDSGGVLLGGGSKDYSKKYGLTSWLSLGADTVVLEPGESRAVPVTVENRDDLQPGGHYGAVVASVNSLDDRSGDKVLINQQLLSLILVKKAGGVRYDLKLSQIGNDGNWLHLPNTVNLRFQNPGNVHVVPRGIVRLKSPSGKVLKTGIINSESAFVLPESFRELYVPLTVASNQPALPGPYTIEVEYRYDGLQDAARKSAVLQYVSLPTYLVLGVVLIIIFVCIKHYKKSHKKSQITE